MIQINATESRQERLSVPDHGQAQQTPDARHARAPPTGFPMSGAFTNTCIAADLADPRLIKEMETGQKLQLEVADSSVLAVTTALPINQFAAVRQGTPAQTFEHNIDE